MNLNIFQRLPDLLREETSLTSLLGLQNAELVIPDSAQAIAIANLSRENQRKPLLVVLPNSSEAEKLFNDLCLFVGSEKVELFHSWETLPFETISPGVETMGKRLRIIHRLLTPTESPEIVVTYARALAQKLQVPSNSNPMYFRIGEFIDQTNLLRKLLDFGYKREYQVEHRGEVSIRGSIVDLWPSTSDAPVRIDFWGDEIERLCEFGVADQRAKSVIEKVEIFPCREFILDSEMLKKASELVEKQPWGSRQWERLANAEMFDGMESWMPWFLQEELLISDLFGGDALFIFIEKRRIRDRISNLIEEEEELAKSLSKVWSAGDSIFPGLHVSTDRAMLNKNAPLWFFEPVAANPKSRVLKSFNWGSGGPRENFSNKKGNKLFNKMAELLADDFHLVVAADGEGSGKRLLELLEREGLSIKKNKGNTVFANPGATLLIGNVEKGFILPQSRLALITESEITGRRRTHRKIGPRRKSSMRVFEDLSVGDYVVHEQHGIARFAGLVSRSLVGIERDYLLLEYRGKDRLYLPTDQIEVIRPYSSGDTPSLSRMGGIEWDRTKSRVRSAIAEIAEDLVELYKKRTTTKGRSFGEDSPWQAELEQAFPYQETPDQLVAIEEVKADMESPTPMDRVVCGDVGFGKTEVALRAAFKAVQAGSQVAVLVPTTLLAQQHGETFRDRFISYPVRVEVLSRFLTTLQVREVLKGLKEGSVDVVIGTHRLLSKDVMFKDLGLLVIDEEQRFGVSHKEALKAIRTEVDVLTLTATPIPRTLEMSLTGIRDLSLIDTPPADRQPVLTFVGEYEEKVVVEAVRRELLREGQMFFIHNRVHDIEQVAAGIKELVPEARIAVAHGQMNESMLESVIIDFWEGKYDVLVCTTIIESGIDMPTVNTLVVDRADLMGLGQLHQLRGRVGRSGQRAYAYLFTPIDHSLSEEAFERLRTIGETTELGSGFRLAMRDLEMRGAGNLLGVGQSGHVASVGYDLYCQMVTEAVAEISGVEKLETPEIRVEIPVDAHLPESYVTRGDLRLEAYRKLAAAGSTPDSSLVQEIRNEWKDRYGPIPESAEMLLAVGHLRTICVQRGITEVTVTKKNSSKSDFLARCSPVILPLSRQTRLQRLHPDSLLKDTSAQLQITLSGENPVETLVAYLEDLVPVKT